MATSPVNWLIEDPLRQGERGHKTAKSRVKSYGWESGGEKTAIIEIYCQGRYVYAELLGEEASEILPAILNNGDRKACYSVLAKYFSNLSDKEALELLSTLLAERG